MPDSSKKPPETHDRLRVNLTGLHCNPEEFLDGEIFVAKVFVIEYFLRGADLFITKPFANADITAAVIQLADKALATSD